MATRKNSITKPAHASLLAFPALKKGEHYAGIIVTDGKPAHHVILLTGKNKPATWDKAVAWAKKAGGELPSRREQSLLFANVPEQFEQAWYWSGTPYAGDDDYAWGQGFYDGTQDYWPKGTELRARAVRRVII